MTDENSGPQVVSVMNSPSIDPDLTSPKMVSSEKKTKTPKIFQKLLQRKSVDHAALSSPIAISFNPSSSTTSIPTAAAAASPPSQLSTQHSSSLVQSQQEFTPSPSSGKTRRRTLFKHNPGLGTSILTSSSSSSSSSYSKIPCGYECGILRLGILIVKSKYLYFDENPSLYNILSGYGDSGHEVTICDPIRTSNTPQDMFPLKVPFSSIIGISKSVNDFSYEINVYTSTEVTHTIVFEDPIAYQNAYSQIEKMIAHKRHTNFSLGRFSSKMESLSNIADDDTHSIRKRHSQSDLRYGQQVENVELSVSPPPPLYYSCQQEDDSFYESDEAVLEVNTHKKRKKHKKKKNKIDSEECGGDDNRNEEECFDVNDDEKDIVVVVEESDGKEGEEEDEEEEFEKDKEKEAKIKKSEINSNDTKNNNNVDSEVIICNNTDNSSLVSSKEPEGKKLGEIKGSPEVVGTADEQKEKEEDRRERRKRRRRERMKEMVARRSSSDNSIFATNALYFILGVIVTVLVQRIF